MTGSCPVSARVCRETARERDEARAEVERLRAGLEARDPHGLTLCTPCSARPKETEMSDHLDRAAEVIYVEVLGLPGYSPDAVAGHNRHSYRGDCQCNAYDRSFARRTAEGLDAAGLLVTPERDAAIRADERARVSVIHSTLTDEALVAELVRRGVLRAAHRDDGIDLAASPRPRYDVQQTRYVTEWEEQP